MSRTGFNTPSTKTAMGGYGFDELIATSSGTGNIDRIAIIQAKSDSVISFVNDVEKGILSESSYTLLDGDVIYGFFHSIIVASGKIRIYYTQE